MPILGIELKNLRSRVARSMTEPTRHPLNCTLQTGPPPQCESYLNFKTQKQPKQNNL